MRLRVPFVALAVVGLTGLGVPTAGEGVASTAATVSPSSVTVSLHRSASGMAALTYVTSARDGSGRLFAVEQRGVVRVVKSGTVASRYYLDIRSKVVSGGEQGLLSIAFHPDFVHHPYVYAAYTRAGDGALQVSSFHAASAASTSVSSATEVHILTVKHPNQTNHNGGQLMFGRYGYLYITTGDGGGAGDPYRNAENMRSALAKLLRIDIDHHCGSYNYCNPPTNPWAKSTTVLRDIFDFGLRNPWRASIDRADGSIWIGDVGQDRYEEIDHVSPSGGKDFGWSCREANATYNSDACTIGGKARSMTRPVTYYGHGTNDSNGCAVIGGYAYHGPNYPFAAGLYVYADWCSGHIWALGRTSTGGYSVARVGQTSVHITGFGEGDKGEIWAVDDAGELFHVAFAKR